jgi:hypothetical protein
MRATRSEDGFLSRDAARLRSEGDNIESERRMKQSGNNPGWLPLTVAPLAPTLLSKHSIGKETDMNKIAAAALALGLGFGWGAASAAETYALIIKDHKFDPAELKIPADKAATLIVKNLDATPEEFESKPLRIEKVVPANSEATFQLRPLKPGRYKFFGEFHEDSAKGEVVVE